MNQTDILLESGTNEVEIAEFRLCGQNFGVNVAKIREFLPMEGVTISKIPGRHPSVCGVFMLRGKTIPLIDLNIHLSCPQPPDESKPVIVITDFNNLTTAYVADSINRIHRVSWSDFQPLNSFLAADTAMVIGSITLEDREVFILDLEHIVGEIFPTSVINYDPAKFEGTHTTSSRADVKVIFAEDSPLIRKRVGEILKQVGFKNLASFDNGQTALEEVIKRYELVQAEGRDISTELNLIITDIEMPQMDGLTLCRKVKKELGLQIPVIMFSSLINKQMALKCDAVGAEAYTSKPETEKLIQLSDSLTLG